MHGGHWYRSLLAIVLCFIVYVQAQLAYVNWKKISKLIHRSE